MVVMMPDLPDSLAESTEDCSFIDDILAIFSTIDADLSSLGPASPALSTDPEITILPPPIFQTYLTNPGLIDKQDSFEFTFTSKAGDTDPTVEIASTAGVQILTDNRTGVNTSFHPPILLQLVVAFCTKHTLMAITSLFSSTNMVWTLPLEIKPHLCSPYSPATTTVY